MNHRKPNVSIYSRRRFLTRAVARLLILGGISAPAFATEHGASTYPVGVDTVFSGDQPAFGKTVFYNYSNTYFANEVVDGNGKSAAPEFKLRVAADAVKFVHDWGIHFLGGSLHSNIAIPLVNETLHTPGGRGDETGLGNISIAVLGTSYHAKNVNWYYEGDVFLPSGGYDSSHIANIGQHNFAGGPVAAVTYLPFNNHTELSSKVQYLFNSTNGADKYSSGNEFTWEFDGMQKLTKHLAAGVNGFLFQQATDDKQNGVVVENGYRGRDLGVGPELRIHFGSFGGAFKWEKDTLVENRARGNALWFQFAIPLKFLNNKHL
jgi:hypothetical protein